MSDPTSATALSGDAIANALPSLTSAQLESLIAQAQLLHRNRAAPLSATAESKDVCALPVSAVAETKDLESSRASSPMPRQVGEDARSISSYPDLLLLPRFLLPFLSISAVVLVGFGIVQGMCIHGIPGNCNLSGSSDKNQIIEQVIVCIERVFLILAIGQFAFLWTRKQDNEGNDGAPRIKWAYTIALHLCALASCVIVSAALNDIQVRKGINAKRIVVGIVLLVGLLSPLIYTLVAHNTRAQRIKSGAVLIFYLTFLVATAGVGHLHVHHWSWSFIYLVVAQFPSHPREPAVSGATRVMFHRVMVTWAHFAAMFALGILIQGFAAYSSLFFFISTTVPCEAK